MIRLLIIIFIILTGFINAQNEFQSFLNRVNSLSSQTEKNAVIDSFIVYARTKGIPFIESNTANFIYRNNVSSVALAGDMNGWNPANNNLQRLSGTDFFYISKNYELNARLDYKYVINGSTWILDPENPNKVSGGYGPNSELAMPEYIQPWEIVYDSNIQHGTTESFLFYSTLLNRNYQIRVYLPYGYDSQSSNYSVVYFQDGSEYYSLGSVKNVLDNLIYHNYIDELIGVFVTPTNRNIEYAGGDRFNYAQFFATELVNYIDQNYSTIAAPSNRLVIGDSFGGNISALISFNFPDVFGNCGLHSAAFWPNNYEVYNLFVNNNKKEINLFAIWGTYESLYQNMRNFRDIMIQKGYTMDWDEKPEGHSWGLWRATTDDILRFFFPKQSTNTYSKEDFVKSYQLYQNYPNPFNPRTTIKFSIPANTTGVRLITLKIYDILGNEVAALVNEPKAPGNYEVEFVANNLSSGVYFYRLGTEKFISIKKMILMR